MTVYGGPCELQRADLVRTETNWDQLRVSRGVHILAVEFINFFFFLTTVLLCTISTQLLSVGLTKRKNLLSRFDQFTAKLFLLTLNACSSLPYSNAVLFGRVCRVKIISIITKPLKRKSMTYGEHVNNITFQLAWAREGATNRCGINWE